MVQRPNCWNYLGFDMRGNSYDFSRRYGWKLVSIQAIVTLVASCLAGLFGPEFFLAAFCGGLIATTSSALMAIMVFKSGRIWQPRELLGAFSQGTALKFLVVTLGFALVSWLLQPPFLPLIGGFVVAYSVYWFALIANASKG